MHLDVSLKSNYLDMRGFTIVIMIAFLTCGCTEQTASKFGEPITADNATDLVEFVNGMGNEAEVSGKVTAQVIDVCQRKGCWMNVEGPDGSEIRVTFKDYGFFVPKNCAGKTVVLDGFAYTDTTSVAELKHYAEDAERSEEEIAAITEPEITVSFEARGVIIQ